MFTPLEVSFVYGRLSTAVKALKSLSRKITKTSIMTKDRISMILKRTNSNLKKKKLI